jgi:hypothetical protein
LQSVADQSLALRRQQVAAAESIIAEHVLSFKETLERGVNWRASRATHPNIAEHPLRPSEL